MRKLSPLLLLFIGVIPAYSQDCDSLNNLFRQMLHNGEYSAALSLANKNETNCKNLGEKNQLYISTLINLGDIYFIVGKYDSSLFYDYKAMFLQKQTFGEDSNYAYCLNNIGATLTAKGKYDSSIIILDSAIKIYSSVSMDLNLKIADVYNNLALAYEKKDEYGIAKKNYFTAQDLFKRLAGINSDEYANGLNNLSVLYYKTGEIDKALAFLDSAIKIKKITVGINHPDYFILLNNQANNYREIGNYKSALALQKESMQFIKNSLGELHPSYATFLSNLSLTFKILNNYDSALLYANESLSIRKKTLPDNHPATMSLQIEIAALKNYLGKSQESINDLQHIVDLKKSLHDTTGFYYAIAFSNMGLAYYKLGFIDSSLRCYVTAIDKIEQIFGSNHISYARLISSIAFDYYLVHNDSLFLKYFNQSTAYFYEYTKKVVTTLSLNKRNPILYFNIDEYSVFQSILFSDKPNWRIDRLYANQMLLSTIVFDEAKKSLNSTKENKDTTLVQKLNEINRAKSYLAKQYTLPLVKQAPNLKEKEAEANELEQQLALLSAAYHRYEKSINISTKDIFNELKAGEAAIEFTSFRFHNKYGWTDSTLYAAIILAKNNPNPQWVYLFEEKQIKQLLFNVHPNLLYSNAKIIQTKQPQYGDKLYHLIWKKIQPWLMGISTVYFSPSGILNQVALGAIPFAGGAATIGNTYRLVQMGSTKNIVVQEPALPLKDIALMGGIQYNADSASYAANSTDSSLGTANIYTTTIMRAANKTNRALDYLPATLTEVDSITATATTAGLSGQLYTNTTATEEMFKSLSGNSPSILHLATHGFYVPYSSKKANDDISQTSFSLIDDPMLRSGIALAGANLKWNKNIDVPNREDGIVTAYEIAQMDFSKTELVVLSACESGLGDIDGSEGVFGLQRGFKSAGVNKLILTLWQVPDKASMQFMTEFYKNWLIQHKEMRAAFWQAQQTMRKIYPKEPSKWAGFILVE